MLVNTTLSGGLNRHNRETGENPALPPQRS